MLNVTAKHDIITPEEISMLLTYAKSSDELWQNADAGVPFWDGRGLYPEVIAEKGREDVVRLIYDIRDRIADVIREHYKQEPYADLIHMVRWPDGIEQPCHADDMKFKNDDEHYEWFYHRKWGSILYLNDDFDGGHTYYDNYNTYVKPKAGTVIVHPTDSDHWHGVTKVSGNTRYTIASFWGIDKSYEHEWLKV